MIKILLAQLNFATGDITANADKIIAVVEKAQQHHADMIVFPELALTGYTPEDLLLRSDFQDSVKTALRKIQTCCKDIYCILGTPRFEDDHIYNSAIVMHHSQQMAHYDKQELPNYGVFDEPRYFTAGTQPLVVTIKNRRFAIIICEDLWSARASHQAKAEGAEFIICLNASPFHYDKLQQRHDVIAQRQSEISVPIFYVNLVGAQDEFVFDGGSFVVNAQGEHLAQAKFFEEDLLRIEIDEQNNIISDGFVGATRRSPSSIQNKRATRRSPLLVYKALVLAVRDYIGKNNIARVLLGLSGGIDSALVLAIAVDALGAASVRAILMPSRYTSPHSIEDAELEAQALNVDYSILSIEPAYTAFMQTLAPEFIGLKTDLTEENLQARCRGTLLMALANKTNALVLTTGNKTEMAVGYATLYGDMAGGFDVLKDVPKMLVYELATYRNKISAVIPERVITRAPTAELAPDQTDQDTLPPYPILDEILERYVEHDQTAAEIIAAGFSAEVVHNVIQLVKRAEYKRRQAAPGPRVTPRGLSRDRRYPITSGF
ncbi:MAG: NAD+ synthase [Gammaproteobacteria bacterium]|nr:NAD+ synthase [Gammaproteobacteria bacterium]